MNKELHQKLLKHARFLESEMMDYPKFEKLTRQEYASDRDKRRNVERWAENIINSTIDIAQTILTIESLPLPDSYKETVGLLSNVKTLGVKDSSSLSEWVRFRNILAHEYIDIRWKSLEKFITDTQRLYKDFVQKTKDYLRSLIESETGS